MFTDLVGYTHLSQSNESLALELLEEHRSLLRPAFQARGGTEVKTIGDAFLVEFKSALDAVTCAVEMQERMRERNAATSPSRRLELRIGVHVGDVVHGEGGDIYGDAVNVASRLEPLAEPGGICISQQVFDQIRNKTPLELVRVGDVRLKNVDLPQGVYRVKVQEGPDERRAGEREEDPPAPRERLAVLPFVNISPDPSDEYFADGLTEELIAKLSQVRGLKVIARTSVMSYKGKYRKVSEIAAELGVGSIIEGSVRKAGDRVRISVQLVDARTEEHLWSSNYDSRLDDIFAIQTDVASKVAASLSSAGLFFSSRAARKDTDDVEAYTLYLRAMQLSYEFTEAALRETVALLQRAVAKDPGFARAYAALANAWHALGVSGYEDFTSMAKRAETDATKALSLDPGLAEAHAAMAGVHSMMDRFDQALAEAEAAIGLNPNLSEAYTSLGILDCIVRTARDALESFKRAYELDPLSPGSGETLASLAGWVGEDRLALDVLARMREFHAKDPRIHLHVADYHMERGDLVEAQKELDAARSLGPDEPAIAACQALLFARAGRRREAEDLLEREVLTNRSDSFRLNGTLWVRAALGDLDEAFGALMKEAETHSWPAFVRVDPLYAGMRNDARYLEFCRKVGIPP